MLGGLKILMIRHLHRIINRHQDEVIQIIAIGVAQKQEIANFEFRVNLLEHIHDIKNLYVLVNHIINPGRYIIKQAAYKRCNGIDWDGAFTRRDIGHRAITREQTGSQGEKN